VWVTIADSGISSNPIILFESGGSEWKSRSELREVRLTSSEKEKRWKGPIECVVQPAW